jgi:hypothetical protein
MQATAARRTGELVLPGVAVGLLAGAMAGLLAVAAGLEGAYVLATAVLLGVPLALGGALYNWLIATGRGQLGSMSFGALVWLPLFPLCRTVQELGLDLVAGRPLALPDGVVLFLVWQVMLAPGYVVGFVLLHERVATHWWLRIRDHNPVADAYVEQYKRQAVLSAARKSAAKEARERSRREKAGAEAPGSTGH